MALWDMGVLVCAMGDYGLLGLVQLVSDTFFHKQIFAYLARYFHGFSVTAMTGSIWVTVAIAVVRCRAVTRPFQSLSARTVNARVACIILSICAIVYCLPCHFEIGLVSCYCNVTQRATIQLWPNLFGNNLYRTLYRSICYSIFVSGGPFIAILVLSLHTVSVLRSSPPNVVSRLHEGRRRVRLLFALLLLKFLLTHFPSTAIMMTTAVFGQQIMLAPWTRYMANTANLCVLLHNATNFLIYINPCWNKSRRTVRYPETTSLLDRSATIQISRAPSPALVSFECKRLYEIFVMVTDGNGSIFIDWLQKEENIAKMLQDPSPVANNIYRFLHSLIRNMWHDPGSRWTIRVRNMVRVHRTKEFQLSEEILDDFERFLVSEGGRCKYRLSAEDLGLWNRFVGSVVAEMKTATDYHSPLLRRAL